MIDSLGSSVYEINVISSPAAYENWCFFFSTQWLQYVKSFNFKAYKGIEHLKLVNNNCYCKMLTKVSSKNKVHNVEQSEKRYIRNCIITKYIPYCCNRT